MKKVLFVASLVWAFLPAAGAAQSVFDGTWKTDVSSIDFPAKPVVYVFKDGMFECKTCATKTLVKTDGRDQKIEGNPYADTLSVKIIDKFNLEMVNKKAGKVVSKRKVAVSVDGNSMKIDYANNSSTNSEVVKGANSYARTQYDKTAPHQMSGSWKAIKAESRSDNGLIVTYKTEGDMLTMSQPTGESYAAKTNGSDAPYKGDPGVTTVSLKLVKKNILEETFKRDGKVVATNRMDIDAAGKKAKIDWVDYLTRTNGSEVMMKQ